MLNGFRCLTGLFLTAALTGTSVSPVVADDLRVGAIFSTAQASSQSFLRFHNTGSSASTATVTFRNSATGQVIGQWTSPSIPGGAELQYAISTPEAALGAFTKPSYYAISVTPEFSGYFQHVLWKPADGTLTNLSTCETGVTIDTRRLVGVHSTVLDSGYPSSIVVNNTGVAATTVALGVYDARDGVKLGTYTTASIAAGANSILPVSTIETGIGVTPASDLYHYVIRVEGAFIGFVQHLVNNIQAGVVTDMSTACTLTASTASTTTAFTGIVAGSNNQSGTLSVSLMTALGTSASAKVAVSSSAEKQQAVITATGSFVIVGGSTITLTGTYDTVTLALSLAGSGYTFTGSLATSNGNQVLKGTYTGPNNFAGGFSAERELPTIEFTSYCGTFTGTNGDGSAGNGTWNFTISSTSSVSGRYANFTDGESGDLRGQSSGTTTISFSGDAIAELDPTDATFEGTIQNGTVSGTYDNGTTESGGGTFSGGVCGA